MELKVTGLEPRALEPPMKITRRNFLQTATAITAAGLIEPPPLWAAPAWEHRIVRVHQPLASFFDVLDFTFQKEVPETYYGHWVSQSIVSTMFDAALCALTGEADATKAMRRLVPYRAGERVFIKINTTTTYEMWKGDWGKIKWDPHYNDTDSIAEPVNAILRALTRIGVPQELIGVGDATWSEGFPDSAKRTPRLTPDRLAKRIREAFPKVALYRSSFMPDGNGITWNSNHRDAVVEFRDPLIDRRKERVPSHRVPDQLIEAAHFINVPIMKRHDSAGVTGAFKNNFGTICSCAYFHEPRYHGAGQPGAMFHSENNPAVDIWLNPHVGAKTRLIVCDAIFGGWNWGFNPPTGWKSFDGRSPNCLLLGTDPVAMDSVIFDHVTESLPDKVKDYPPPAMLRDAAKMGLGWQEHRTGPKAGYQRLDYREIEPAVDPAKLRQLATLKTKFLQGTKTAGEIRDLLAQARAVAG
jgi:hypothetical protein